MTRRSEYTNLYTSKAGKKPIPFPHIVDEKKKEVYFRITSGWPATLAVKPIMREHFPDDYKGYIASDKTWENYMKDLPPHFIIVKDKKVVFLIKGMFSEHKILSKYMFNFPKEYKGIVMRCEESFYKMRINANN